jgi:3-oxoacyl-[acyl-carrier-protein] synthase II
VSAPGRAGAPIAITGFSAVTPIGIGRDGFERGLRAGTCGVDDIDLFDASAYRSRRGAQVREDVAAAFADAGRRAAVAVRSRHGRAARFALAAVADALIDAGIGAPDCADSRCGIVVGGCTAGTFESEGRILRLQEGDDYWRDVPAHELLVTPVGTTTDVLVGAIGCRGPAQTVSTACSSASNAIGLAMRWIRRGRCDRVVVVGADAMCRLTHAGFNALRLVDPERPRPFDARRQGMAIGEGAGAFVLESADRAMRRGARPRGWLLGFGNGAEGWHATQPRPDGEGAACAMRAALVDAGLPEREVDYVNAHGTATPQNDVTEARGIRAVFGARDLPVSSTKSQTGHLLGASGAVELAAVLLGMGGGFLPPTVGFGERDPEIDLDVVPNEARPGRIGIALSNSFAFGGNDVCLAIGHPEARS